MADPTQAQITRAPRQGPTRATWVIGILIVCVGLLAACGDTASAPTLAPVAPQPAVQATSTPLPAVVEPAPTDMPPPPADTPVPAPVAQELAVGSTAEIDGLKVTLNEVRHETEGLIKAKAGMEYIVLNVTLENTAAEPKPISSLLSFYVKDDTGQKYTPGVGANIKSGVDGTVAAGDKNRGELGVEVPLEARGLVFIYEPFMGRSVLRFKLDR